MISIKIIEKLRYPDAKLRHAIIYIHLSMWIWPIFLDAASRKMSQIHIDNPHLLRSWRSIRGIWPSPNCQDSWVSTSPMRLLHPHMCCAGGWNMLELAYYKNNRQRHGHKKITKNQPRNVRSGPPHHLGTSM